MAIIKSTVVVGQKIPKEVIREVRRAARKPIRYSEDCPPLSPEALKEFAQLAAERDRRKKKKSIKIRITQDILERYKKMGDGYTSIMADVLAFAADNPEILSKAHA